MGGLHIQHLNMFLKECKWRFNINAQSKLLANLISLHKEGY